MSTKNSIWVELARFIIDAFDVDIQIYISRLLKKLRKTPSGAKLAEWAVNNPIAFEALIRLISASVQRLPKDKNILVETVVDQLERLPFEARRAILGDAYTASSNLNNSPFLDDEFQQKYREALEDLSEKQLAEIASLDHTKLQEWVNSPPQIRPYLLEKWCKDNKKGGIPKEIEELMHKAKNWMERDIKKRDALADGNITQKAKLKSGGNWHSCVVKTPFLTIKTKSGRVTISTNNINSINFVNTLFFPTEVYIRTTDKQNVHGRLLTKKMEFAFDSAAKMHTNILKARKISEIKFSI